MFRRINLSVVGLLFFFAQAFAQDIPAPRMTPVASTESHAAIIHDAIALHDQGDYGGAISKYQQVLAENPNDVLALYEMGYSYFAKKDFNKSLETAYKGAQYNSKYLPGFYVLIGNNLDHLKEHEKAIKAYKAGIKLFPDAVQLHYNLAVTYASLNKFEDAKKSFKEAVAAEPNHPSSHLGLSQTYSKDNYKIPAMLALCRFLIVEPNSNRSVTAIQTLKAMAQSGVKSEDDKKITILMDASAKTDEGDFDAASLALSLMGAARRLEESKNKTQAQLFVDSFDMLFSAMGNSDKKSAGFAWNYYRPYFVEMQSRKYVEPFCYYIQQTNKSDEVQNWLLKNHAQVEEFLKWSRAYRWSKGK
jgi:tetratricopeptide (TPR) repeat protein